VTLTVALPNFGSYLGGEWHRFFDLARMADAAGVDRIVVADHVVMGARTDAYGWGRFTVAPNAPWLEPLTMLSGMSAVTAQVRLGTSILIAPLRGATILAKTVSTLDVLSRGRLDLGVGVGWQREEYEAAGIDFSRRGALLSDTMAACRVLWRDLPARFHSDSHRFDDIYCAPLPVQPGGPPIWISGNLHERNLARLLAWGNGWIPIPITGASLTDTVRVIADGLSRLRPAWEGAGRDPASLDVRAALPLVPFDGQRRDLGRCLEAVPDLLGAGATDVSVPIHAFCRDIDGADAFFEEAVRRFRLLVGG
jgi:probable F420-dependent oxidoreductase